MQEHDSYISRETLSADILNEFPDEEACTESFKLDGHEVVLGVKRQKS